MTLIRIWSRKLRSHLENKGASHLGWGRRTWKALVRKREQIELAREQNGPRHNSLINCTSWIWHSLTQHFYIPVTTLRSLKKG
jgi:hypothetical protein